MHKFAFHGHFGQTCTVGDLLHSEIMGPFEISFPERVKYASTFLDDYSRYTLFPFMAQRRMLIEAFRNISERNRSIGGRRVRPKFSGISKLHSDSGKDHVELIEYLGRVHQDKSFSPSYTSQLNGIAERVNRTTMGAALSLLIQANPPS